MEKITSDSRHLHRWLTAMVAVPLLVVVISLGPAWLVLLLVLTATSGGLVELARLLFPEPRGSLPTVALGAGLVLPLAAYWQGSAGLTAATIAALFVSLSLLLLFFSKGEKEVLRSLGAVVFAHLYIPFALSHIILLFQLPAGRRWVFFVLVVIFAGDTGAYYIGRQWGRHKLAPALSPKKTVEGAAGGLICSLVLGLAAGKVLVPAGVGVSALLVLALALAVVGQVGDLIESMLKRLSQVKDAGGFLPGHGGLLDRLDSLLFAFPLTYYGALFLTGGLISP